MFRAAVVLVLSVQLLAAAGGGTTSRVAGSSTRGPVPAQQATSTGSPTTIRWDKFYDRSGNPLPGEPADGVSSDSLYWKDLYSTSQLKSSAKAQNPAPADRSAMAFHDGQSTVCMDPPGNFVYEVNGTNLYRFSTADGSMTTYTLSYTGGLGCATDGEFIYRPSGTTMYKYTLTGTYVSSTTTNYSCDAFSISCCRDTVWFTNDRYNGVNLYGYACSKFSGGSITHDATWNVGTGINGVGNVAWDGTYFYLAWIGTGDITFKRFNADRTLYSTGTVSIDPRSVMCRQGGYGVMMCDGALYPDYVASLRQLLADSCGGKFATVDTYHIGSTGGHEAFPATEWYNLGYRAILAFTDEAPLAAEELGDSLARFIQLGGGVVEAVFGDCSSWNIAGDWLSRYAPFAVQPQSNTSGAIGTVHQPSHPVMASVSALNVGDWRTGSTHNNLRGPNAVCLAEYTDASRCLAASFDSAGQRAAAIGMFPLTYWQGSASGQWVRLIANALNWAAVGPSVALTAPNGGENWAAGFTYTITWNQTANGVSDSLCYSTDAGASWTGLAHHDPSPNPREYVWLVPDTPTDQARVKVVTWDADGGRVEDRSDANFTISGTGMASNDRLLPRSFALDRPRPNPLAYGAEIGYALPRPGRVELRIYDVAGTLVRQLVEGEQPAGYRLACWNARDDRGRAVAPGVYYCRLKAGGQVAAQKLVVRL